MPPPFGDTSERVLPTFDEALPGLKRQRESQKGSSVSFGGLLFQRDGHDEALQSRWIEKVTAAQQPTNASARLEELLCDRGLRHLGQLRDFDVALSRSTSDQASTRHHTAESIEAEAFTAPASSEGAICRVASSPSLTLFQHHNETGLPANPSSQLTTLAKEPPLTPSQQRAPKKIRSAGSGHISSSVSAPNLQLLLKHQKKPTVLGLRSATEPSTQHSGSCMTSLQYIDKNPDQMLRTIIESQGRQYQTYSSLELNDTFFLAVTPQRVSGYSSKVITAVREANLDELHRMQSEGITLQCCNKFGESIVHMACRRGSIEVVKFLLQNDVSLRVCDDYGRTPLHDACWTREPHLELVKLVIEKCSDLLFCMDKRGFTPLSYVRRDSWGIWCKFLDENRELVLPRTRILRKWGR